MNERRFRNTHRRVTAFARTATGAVMASVPEALMSLALVGSAALLAVGAEAGPRAGTAAAAARFERGPASCPTPAAGAEALADWYALLWTDLE